MNMHGLILLYVLGLSRLVASRVNFCLISWMSVLRRLGYLLVQIFPELCFLQSVNFFNEF